MPDIEKVDGNPFIQKVDGNPFAPAKKTDGTLSDMVKSAGAGVGRLVDQGLGQFGDVAQHAFTEPLQNVLSLAGAVTGRDVAPAKAGLDAVSSVVTPKTSAQIGADRAAAGLDHTPQTTAGKYARTAAEFAPNAVLAPGNALARTAAVVVPAIASQFAGDSAHGKKLGPFDLEPVARIAGAMMGGAIAAPNALTPARAAAAPMDQVANALRPHLDVEQATAQANALTAAGAQPTLASVGGQTVQGMIRAAAGRNTPARELVQNRADAAALNLPDRIGGQARAVMSDDPRTPMAIATDLAAQRKAAGDANFSTARHDTVTMPPTVITALSTPAGRSAIKQAATNLRSSLSPADRALADEIDGLIPNSADTMSPEMSVGAAQAISKNLLDAADAAYAAKSNHQASILGELGRAVRDNARGGSQAYGKALDEYSADSRLMEAAEKGEDFLKRNTDEFVAETPTVGQPGNDLARATARRAIERAVGENPSSALGVASKLANAPEQQARNAHLLGPEDAARLQAGVSAEAKTARDLRFVAPNTGSPTQQKLADASHLDKVVEIGDTAQKGIRAFHGDLGAWISLIKDHIRTRGLDDAGAEALATASTDPAQLNDILAHVARQQGGQKAVPRLLGIVKEAQRRALAAPRYAAPAALSGQ